MPQALPSTLTSPERRDLNNLALAIAAGLIVWLLAPFWLGFFLSVAVFSLTSLAT